MIRTAARLRENGVAVALVDPTALGRNLTVEQWYGGLLDQLGRQLGREDELERFWLAHGQLGPLQRWMTAVREVVLSTSGVRGEGSGVSADGLLLTPDPSPLTPAKLVIFIDEIDAVRSLTFSTDELFAAIRECFNRRAHDPRFRQLTFCLLGVASPSDLIQDARTTPFNIGRRIELTDFTEVEAAPLAAGLGVGRSVFGARCSMFGSDGSDGSVRSPNTEHRTPNAQDRTPHTEHLLRRILYWTGGHPYLTQRLCRAVAEAQNPKSKTQNPKSEVDRLCQELFLSPQARERDTNLLFVRERLLRRDGDLTELLELYARAWAGKRVPADETDRRVEVLRLSGIVRVQPHPPTAAGILRVRNRLYHRVFDRKWVLAHLPDAELRRQRAAYRRGLLRATGMSGVILVLMAGLALTAVRNAREGQERLVRLNLYTGERAVESGDLLGALPWFAEACRLDQGDPAREGMDRYRLAAVMRQTPRVVHLWSPGNRPMLPHAWSPDFSRVVLTSAGGGAQVWDTTTDTAASPPMPQQGRPWGAVCGPDDRRVLIPCDNGWLRVWDGATGRPLTPPARVQNVFDTVFISAGSRLVKRVLILARAGGTTVRVWNAATGQPVTPPMRHAGTVLYAAFSPDGRRVITGGTDHTARVWDAATGRPLTAPLHHDWWVTGAAFSPDGRRLILCSHYGGTARVWDAATGQPVTPFLKHTREVPSAAFSPDGRRVVSGCADGAVQLWDVSPDRRPLPDLLLSAQLQASRRVDPTGGSVAMTPEELRQAWQALHSHYPAEFVATSAQSHAWYRLEAAECERERQWPEALRHLGSLIRTQPADPELWARLGSDRAAFRRWAPASVALAKAIQLGDREAMVRYDLARVQLARGDTGGYRRTCAELLHQLEGAPDPMTVNRTVSTCVLSPAFPASSCATMLARLGIDALPDALQGPALYRAGRLEQAVRRLNQDAGTVPPDDRTNPALWLALCHLRLGHAAVARAWLKKAERSIAQANRNGVSNGPGTTVPLTWEEQLALQLLLHEARTLARPHGPSLTRHRSRPPPPAPLTGSRQNSDRFGPPFARSR